MGPRQGPGQGDVVLELIETARSPGKKREIKKRRPRRWKPHDLAVLGIMKNEAWNLDEWIEHYLWMGADHVFLIDNGSTDNSLSLAQAWEERGQVTTMIQYERWRQTRHYWDAIKHFGIRRDYEWLLVADLDEFWFTPDGRSLPETLAALRDLDLLYVNPLTFGSSGHVRHPRSLRRDLVMRAPEPADHMTTKWVCRTKILNRRRDLRIHKIFSAASDRVVSANDLFRVNHYQYQSHEFWNSVKIPRGDAALEARDILRTASQLPAFDALCTVEDRALADQLGAAFPDRLRSVPDLRAL